MLARRVSVSKRGIINSQNNSVPKSSEKCIIRQISQLKLAAGWRVTPDRKAGSGDSVKRKCRCCSGDTDVRQTTVSSARPERRGRLRYAWRSDVNFTSSVTLGKEKHAEAGLRTIDSGSDDRSIAMFVGTDRHTMRSKPDATRDHATVAFVRPVCMQPSPLSHHTR